MSLKSIARPVRAVIVAGALSSVGCGDAGSGAESSTGSLNGEAATLSAVPLTVTPNVGLTDGQQVTVRGLGFFSSVSMIVAQCRADAQSFEEDCVSFGSANTDPIGSLHRRITVRYRIQPSQGEAFECPEGSCMLVALPNRQAPDLAEASRAPIAFDVDADAGPVQRGTLQLDRTSVISGDTVVVTGNGWAPLTTLRLELCNSQSLAICGPHTSIQVAANGTFTANIAATGRIVQEEALGSSALVADCAAPNACAIHAHDVRDLATRVSAPLAIAVRPGVSAAFDLRAPHVPEMFVRVIGSGFTPNDFVDAWQCGPIAILPSPLCRRIATFTADSSGNVRAFARPLRGFFDFFAVECAQAGSTCDLLLTDGAAVATVPIRFAPGESFNVTSVYEAKWQPLLDRGLQLSGLSGPELQFQGASALLWVMTASGATTAAHFPVDGNVAYTTTYPWQTYIDITNRAAVYDYTLDELQKAGTLFWSWVLAGQPPLPTGE